jgi:hypothetical protein
MKTILCLFAVFAVVSAQVEANFPSEPEDGPVQVNPAFIKWDYAPEGLICPGVDFLGWGYDASYRDTFFALKPLLFRWSFANNPKGSERTYQYPLFNDMTWPIPDQVFVRTVSKTVTTTIISDTQSMNRFQLDLRLGLEMSSGSFKGSLELNLAIKDEKRNIRRIVTSMAETQLFQLYLGKRYLNEEVRYDMEKLNQEQAFSSNNDDVRNAYFLFLGTWGTHFVDSVTVGGSVWQTTDYSFSNASNALILSIAIAGEFDSFSGSIYIGIESVKQTIKTETKASATIVGGSADFSDFVLRTDDPAAAAKLYNSWKNTLMENPVAVRYRLVEIWTLWPTLLADQARGKFVCEALAEYTGFGGEDDYCDGVPAIQAFSVRDPTQNVLKGDTRTL